MFITIFWTSFFIYFIGYTVIAISSALWLFNYNKFDYPNKILYGYKYTLFKHFGSVAFASFFILFLYLIRIIILIIKIIY